MIVCHCNAISEEALRKAISEGADDFFVYSEKSGIGDDCGTCFYTAHEMFERFLSEKQVQSRGSC